MMRALILISIMTSMTACSTVETANTIAVSEVASANMVRADGTAAGVANLSQRSDGLWLSVAAEAVGPGTYGMHIHAVGRCDGPTFETAGPHWNPAMKQHGRDNPMGSHAGDMPNVTANADGKLAIETKLTGAMFSEVLDGDGASVVIHAKADDYKTDPSGNSGTRVICGVFKKS